MTCTPMTPLKNAPTTLVGTQDLAPEDSQMLGQLADLWKDYRERGLRVRWQMGALLNSRLGSPTERLAHGEGVLKKAEKQLRISESALSRMRWFAYLFESLEDFQEKHPEKRSWTKARKLLPPLIAAAKGHTEQVDGVACAGVSSATTSTDKPASGDEDCDTNHLDGIWRSLDEVTEKLRGNGFRFDENARSRMLRALQQLGTVINDCFQIRLTIEQQKDA